MLKYVLVLSLLIGGAAVVAEGPQEKPISLGVDEKWPSPTPWLRDRFSDFLTCMPHQAVVVEVGVQEGVFADYILRLTNPKQLYLIDCWEYQNPAVYDDPEANLSNLEQEKFYRKVKNRFAKQKRVTIMKKYSKEAAALFADDSVDWIYIDANHGYEAVKEDLEIWWPKLKSGGYFSGHDYIVRPSFGVVKALNEFMMQKGLTLSYLTAEPGQYDSWAIKKP